MEKANPISILELLRRRQTWLLVGLIFAGRMAYFLYWGTLLEIDSLGYLKMQTALYHPPLYNAFNWVSMRLGRSVDAIVVAQSLLYSLCAAALIGRWGRNGRLQLGLAILLALEPCSGKLACTVMAETVFLSLLMLAWLGLPSLRAENRRRFSLSAIWMGFTMGMAYQTRYAAPVFVVAAIVWMLSQRLPWRRFALGTCMILLAFQFSLFPIRIYYQIRFGTLEFNSFSSLSLWNTSAYLYPGSPIAANPQTEFERYLNYFLDEDFGIYHTWHTNQMFHDSLAFQRFVNQNHLSTAEIQAAATSAGVTARKLLLSSPFRHLRTFVWPNLQRPFSGDDRIFSDLLPAHIDAPLYFHHRHLHSYWSESWWAIFGLLLVSSGLQLRYRKRVPAAAGLLLLSCWLYLSGIAGLAVIFLRFVYLLAPLVVIAIGLQLESLLQPTQE